MPHQGANPVNTGQPVGGVDSGGSFHILLTDNTGVLQTSGGGGGGGTVNQGTPNTPANSWPVEVTDGTNILGTSAHPVRVDPTGVTVQPVSLSANQSVNVAQIAGSSTSTAATGVQKVGVVGNAGAIFDGATAATVPANALQTGLRAATTYPTAVTDGQMVGGMSDKAGRQVAVLNAPRDLVGTAVVSNNSTASGVSFIGSGGAGVFTDIVTLVLTNRSATASVVSLTDGTATYTFAIAANGGMCCNFPTPLPATSSATAWTIGNSATVAFDYVAVYIKNK
jgi:hypothetical protein